MVQKESKAKEKRSTMKWLKGMGVGAFLFFLIKGLIWLAVFFGLFKFCA